MAQSNRLVYDEPVDIETVAKRIADLNQQSHTVCRSSALRCLSDNLGGR